METLLINALTALISALIGAIVGAIVARIKTATKDATDMREMQRQNLKMTCRMAIYDDHFTIDEKLDAYVIYRDTCRGNHTTKTYLDGLVGCDVDEYIEKHRKE